MVPIDTTATKPQHGYTVVSWQTETFLLCEAVVGTKPLYGWVQTQLYFLSGSVQ